MPGVFAFAETRAGELRKVSHETVTAARQVADELGAEVDALLLGGAGIGEAASELGTFGADRVWVGEGEVVAQYQPESYAAVAADLIREGEYSVAVFPASALGKDLAPRVAARLGVGYAGECTDLRIEDGKLIAIRPQYAGKVFAEIGFAERPAIVSVRSNIFTPVENARGGEKQSVEVPSAKPDLGSVIREVRAAAGEALDVAEAPIVVSGGRGLREPDNFKLIEDLADAIGGAAVGASRAVVDAGWRPHAEQVGQTGKTVSPSLYFAIGISGAIQHLAGMRTANTIVAINKDPEAPIFKVADYGIVGDLFEIVPRLTEEIRKMR